MVFHKDSFQIISRESFPKQLLEIPKVPKKLYLRGNMPDPESKMLCVVGARNYSNYGKDVCEQLIGSLKGKNVTIISGLALGIDAIAHEAAIEAGLFTMALPGSGLNDKVLHPQSHVKLAQKIIERGGGLLTEFEPDFKATMYSFPQRNRIMAGLSHAVLIIEAELKSGTLITSRMATDYNRDVFAVPGSIYSKNSAGPHMLIRLGATPITCPQDLHEALGFDTQMTLLENNYIDCGEQEKVLLKILEEPMNRDELITASMLETSEANMYISLLEMKGYIKESLGEIRKIM